MKNAICSVAFVLVLQVFIGCETVPPAPVAQAQSVGNVQVETINTLEKLPPAVVKQYGNIADRGEYFCPSCVREPGVPFRGFQQAWRIGDTYWVKSQLGGYRLRTLEDEFVVNDQGEIVKMRNVSVKS